MYAYAGGGAIGAHKRWDIFYGTTSLRLRPGSFSQIPAFFNKRYLILAEKTFGPVNSKLSGQEGTKVGVGAGGSIGWEAFI